MKRGRKTRLPIFPAKDRFLLASSSRKLSYGRPQSNFLLYFVIFSSATRDMEKEANDIEQRPVPMPATEQSEITNYITGWRLAILLLG
jgi:hypothetical protein